MDRVVLFKNTEIFLKQEKKKGLMNWRSFEN